MNASDGMESALALDIESAGSGKGEGDENFPVARLFAPPHRPIVRAFYRFARAADDIADHPSLPAAKKLLMLDAMAQALQGARPGLPIAETLRAQLLVRGLSPDHALDLLEAFRRDCLVPRTRDFADLLDYCRLSAMPVGRFLLEVHGEDRENRPASDALCAALQIINHLQDCGKDFQSLDRVYLPDELMARHGADVAMLKQDMAASPLRAVLDELLDRTQDLLAQSAPFAQKTRDRRLALDIAAIQALAERLVAVLRAKDPLREKVHLNKAQFGWVAGRAALIEQWGRWTRAPQTRPPA